MSNLQIIRRERNINYTTISNQIFRDKGISLKARGLFATVMALPPEWELSVHGLVTILREGEVAIRGALDELIEAGYCVREQTRGPGGRGFGPVSYVVYETPKNTDPSVRRGFVDAQDVDSGNPPQLSTKELSTDQINSAPNGAGAEPPSFVSFAQAFFAPPLGQQPPPTNPLRSEEKPAAVSQTPQEFIFGEGLQFLIRNGVKEQQARSVLGKFLRDYYTEDVMAMIESLPEGRLDYVPYMTKLMSHYMPKNAHLKTVDEVTVEREQFATTVIAPPPGLQHVWHKCSDDCDGCMFCHGGLAFCTVCKLGEDELGPICPGPKLEKNESNIAA